MTSPLDAIRRSPATARLRMAAPLPRLTASRGTALGALRRALRSTSLDRLSRPEREWRERIEAKRAELLADPESTGPSFETGVEGEEGRFSMGHERTTVAVAAWMMSLTPAWCTLIMRLVRELAPQRCLELGTGFGISSAYVAAALELNGDGELRTLEGSPEWAERAERSLAELGLAVAHTVGPIAETLPGVVERDGPFDFVFVDAEHQGGATIEQFEQLKPGLEPGALVVFDDVNWPEMRSAYAEIGRDPRVASSRAIGRLGFSVIDGAAGTR